MSRILNKKSLMECSKHGLRKPAFVCQHLVCGVGIGFYQSEGELEPDFPFENAWCLECENVALGQGGWNDTSEDFAQITPVCEGCFEEIKARN